jgi:hypothetical protein
VTNEQSRFLREARGFLLGYAAGLEVGEDHLIVAQRVNQEMRERGSVLSRVPSRDLDRWGKGRSVCWRAW